MERVVSKFTAVNIITGNNIYCKYAPLFSKYKINDPNHHGYLIMWLYTPYNIPMFCVNLIDYVIFQKLKLN